MTNSAVPVPTLELIIYIRKRPKEKGLLETKHEFKIFEACVSGADTITISLRTQTYFRPMVVSAENKFSAEPVTAGNMSPFAG